MCRQGYPGKTFYLLPSAKDSFRFRMTLPFSSRIPKIVVALGLFLVLAFGLPLATHDRLQGSISNQAEMGFTLTANPTSVNGFVNVPASSTITFTPIGGFANDVILTSTKSSNSISCTLTPGVFRPTVLTSTLSCISQIPGTFKVNVTGTSSGLTSSTQPITLIISPAPPPDFSITAVPGTLNCSPGGSGTSTVTVASQNGFSGNVILQTTIPSATVSALLSQTTLVGGTGTSLLSIGCGSNVGVYAVSVTGTSGGLSHTTTVQVNITKTQPAGSFRITASPSSLTVLQGCENKTTLTVTSIRFSGTVDLSVMVSGNGVHASLSSVHVNLNVNQSAQVTLSIVADTSAVLGSYNVIVTASHGSNSIAKVVPIIVVRNSSCTTSESKDSNGCVIVDEDPVPSACANASDQEKRDFDRENSSTSAKCDRVNNDDNQDKSSCPSHDDDSAKDDSSNNKSSDCRVSEKDTDENGAGRCSCPDQTTHSQRDKSEDHNENQVEGRDACSKDCASENQHSVEGSRGIQSEPERRCSEHCLSMSNEDRESQTNVLQVGKVSYNESSGNLCFRVETTSLVASDRSRST